MTSEEAADPPQAPAAPGATPLTREALRDGWIQRMVATGGYRVLT